VPSQAYLKAMQVWVEWNKTTDFASPLEKIRNSYEETFLQSTTVPKDVVVREVDANGVPSEWSESVVARGRTILFLHGGGYMVGSKRASRAFAARLAKMTERHVCCIDYRLSPEHGYPAAIEDAVTSYRWLLGQTSADIVVVGESAGGGLAVALIMCLRDAGLPLPSSAVLISPWLDLAIDGDSAKPGASDDPLVTVETLRIMAHLYVGENIREPLASPLHGNLKGLPPMLLMAGGVELLRDDSVRFVTRAASAGVSAELFLAPGMAHIWPLIAPDAPEGIEALQRACEFILGRQPQMLEPP